MKRGVTTIGPRGIAFRSRLECKYALLFEFLDWTWDYEPFDLDGYIPDFTLHFKRLPKLLVETKSDLDYEFREAAEKLFKSGYSKSCIMFDSRSPYWNEERKRVILQAKLVKPLANQTWSKKGWGIYENKEVFFEHRGKRLWTVYDDIGISFCEKCNTVCLCWSDICIFCEEKSLVYRSELRMIPDAWSSFCNQTQWKGKFNTNNKRKIDATLDAISLNDPMTQQLLGNNMEVEYADSFTTIAKNPFLSNDPSPRQPKLSKPKLMHYKQVKISSPEGYFHVHDRKQMIASLKHQFREKGEAYFCGECGWDWYEMIELLNDLDAVYITCKEGFCCDGDYIIVESCNLPE